MSEKIIEKYCRRVRKGLICLPKTKERLLSGLETELSALPPEDAESLERLEAKSGKIAAVNAEYQEAVPEAERLLAFRRKRRNRWRWSILAIAMIVLLLLFILYLLRHLPSVTIIEPPVEIA